MQRKDREQALEELTHQAEDLGLYETKAKHDIGSDNERQNEYWKRVGGHPPPGQQDQ